MMNLYRINFDESAGDSEYVSNNLSALKDIQKTLQKAISHPELFQVPNCLRNPLCEDFFKAVISSFVYATISNEGSINRTTLKPRDRIAKILFNLSGDENYGHRNWMTNGYDGENFENDISKVANNSDVLNILVKRFQCPLHILTLAIARCINISPEYIFDSFPKNKFSNNYKINGTDVLQFGDLAFGQKYFKLDGTIFQKVYDGQVRQASLLYKYNNDSLLAFAVQGNDEYANRLVLGMNPAIITLINRECIISSQDHVILGFDYHSLFILYAKAREANLSKNCRIIISGVLGGQSERDAASFTDLYSHTITIIAQPHSEVWNDLDNIIRKCKKAGCKDISIFPWELKSGNIEYDYTIFSPDKRDEAMKNALDLDNCELISMLAKNIIKSSIPYGKLNKWKIEFGIEKEKIESKEDEPFNFVSLAELDQPEMLKDIKDITTKDVFDINTTSLIWGSTDIGKSWACKKLAIAIAGGESFCGIPGAEPRITAYHDTETGDNLKAYINQLLKGTPDLKDHIRRFLLIYPGIGDGDILKEESYKTLADSLIKKNVSCYIMDNLQSGAESAVKGNTAPLKAFTNILQNNGVARIFFHHSDKQGKTPKGPGVLTQHAQNVIHIEGRGEIKDSLIAEGQAKYKEFWPGIQEALNSIGPLIRLTFDKTKNLPHYKDYPMLFWLPVGGTWRQLTPNPSIQDITPTKQIAQESILISTVEEEKNHKSGKTNDFSEPQKSEVHVDTINTEIPHTADPSNATETDPKFTMTPKHERILNVLGKLKASNQDTRYTFTQIADSIPDKGFAKATVKELCLQLEEMKKVKITRPEEGSNKAWYVELAK